MSATEQRTSIPTSISNITLIQTKNFQNLDMNKSCCQAIYYVVPKILLFKKKKILAEDSCKKSLIYKIAFIYK